MKRFLKNIIFVTVPTLIVLVILLEIFFRAVIPATNPPFACFDEKEGIFKFCENGGEGAATFGRFAQQRARWRINNHGWNSPVDYAAEKTRPRIAVIGDSYIEALQVDTDKNYASLLRGRLGESYDVYSFGISGAALSEYLHISRYAHRLFDPDIFIVNVVHNDFLESIREFNPSDIHMMMLSLGDSTITETGPRPDYSMSEYDWKRRMIRKSAIVRYLFFNLKFQQTVSLLLRPQRFAGNIAVDPVVKHEVEVRRAVDYILGRFAAEYPDKRIVFVMNAPKPDIYTGTLDESQVIFLNRMLGEACRQYGFEILDLTEPMRAAYARDGRKFNSPYDGHWDEYGHRFVCDQVLELGF